MEAFLSKITARLLCAKVAIEQEAILSVFQATETKGFVAYSHDCYTCPHPARLEFFTLAPSLARVV